MSEAIQKAIARRAVRRLKELHTTLSGAGLYAMVREEVILVVAQESEEVLASAGIPSVSASPSSQTNPLELGEAAE